MRFPFKLKVAFKKKKKIAQRSRMRVRCFCACATGTFTTCHTVLYFIWGKREFSSTCADAAAAEWWLTVSDDRRARRVFSFLHPLSLSLPPSLSLSPAC